MLYHICIRYLQIDWLCGFLCKFNETLILGPICPNYILDTNNTLIHLNTFQQDVSFGTNLSKFSF